MSNLGRAWEGQANPVGEIEMTDAQLEAVYGASQTQKTVLNVLQLLNCIFPVGMINGDGSKPVGGSVTTTVTSSLVKTEIHKVK